MLNLGVELACFSGAYAPDRHEFRLGVSLFLFLIQNTAISPSRMIRFKYERCISIR